MASAVFDQRGLVIGLDHDETNELLGVLAPIGGTSVATGVAAITALFARLGITAIVGSAGGYVAIALAVHVAWEYMVIKGSDKGCGVWLYVSPQIWFAGGIGIVIPQTRTCITSGNALDAHANDGELTSGHADLIGWHIDRGAGDDGTSKFVLINECDWAKSFKVYTPQGDTWVEAAGHQQAEFQVAFGDLSSTQIVFHKPQFLGQWGPIDVTLADFSGLESKDVMTFRWKKDN